MTSDADSPDVPTATQAEHDALSDSIDTLAAAMPRTSWGLNTIAASNLRAARLSRGLTRGELAEILNWNGVPPGDPEYDTERPHDRQRYSWWDADRLGRLERVSPVGNRKPQKITLDDLIALCLALEVTVFEILLPERPHLLWGKISHALFGFEMSPLVIQGMETRSKLWNLLDYQPRVRMAAWSDDVEWWRLLKEKEAAAEADDWDEWKRLNTSQNEVAKRRDQRIRLAVEAEIQQIQNRGLEEPTEEQAAQWFTEHHRRLHAELGWKEPGSDET